MQLSLFAQLKDLFLLFINVAIILMYLVYLLPVYFGTSTSTRMIICLIVHPAVTEFKNLVQRLGSVRSSTMRNAKDVEYAKDRLLNELKFSFVGKLFFSLCRRLMLLNLGGTSLTMFAIIFTSIQEALMRAFIVEIDAAIIKWMGAPAYTDHSLELQRIVWANDINLLSIAEIFSIFVATFSYVLLEPHSLAINIGYTYGEPPLVGLAFVQLFLELALEIFVDTSALWAESEHGIPLNAYFERTNSIFVWIFHQSVCIFSFSLCAYCFARYPSVLSCNSNFVCECMNNNVLYEWYNDTCSWYLQNTTLSLPKGGKIERDAFSSLDAKSILIAICGFVGSASLVVFLLKYYRYFKNGKKVKTMATEIGSLKKSSVPKCRELLNVSWTWKTKIIKMAFPRNSANTEFPGSIFLHQN